MFGLGTPKLLVIHLIFVLLLGGARLAGLHGGLGAAIRELPEGLSKPPEG